MIRNVLAALSFLLILGNSALAQTCTVPNTLTNGANADATLVMQNFTALLNCVNSVSLPRGYLNGLTLSTAGSSISFGIASGVATSDDATTPMKLATSYSKTVSVWAVGSNNGSLDAGSIANNTWYHVFLIERIDTGVVDVLVSLSPTSPTLPTNYTTKRRIGSMKTDNTGQWIKFKQIGPTFLWDAAVNDVSGGTIGTTAVSQSVTTPPGVRTRAILNVAMTNAVAGNGLLVSSLDVSDQAGPGLYNVGFVQTSSQSAVSHLEEFTNTSNQVRMRASAASSTYYVWSVGWTDVSLALGL